MLTDEQILGVVESTEETHEICRRLIEKANQNGGEDNITALVIRFDDGEPESESLRSTEAPPQVASGDDAPESKAALG
jgi:protein phosphatase